VSGLPVVVSDHAARVCGFALQVLQVMIATNDDPKSPLFRSDESGSLSGTLSGPTAEAALSSEHREPHPLAGIKIRIGVHTGAACATVLTFNRPSYDVFGDTMDCAEALEQAADPNAILLSETTLLELRRWSACAAPVPGASSPTALEPSPRLG